MNPTRNGKQGLCKLIMSAFGVLAILSIELMVAAALVFSVINKSGPVFLLALFSVPLIACFYLAVKSLDKTLADYQDSSAQELPQAQTPQTLLGLMESPEHEHINAALSW